MPHQTTDRDFPQEGDSAHARIAEAPEIPAEALIVFEIARQVNERFETNNLITMDLIFSTAVTMAFHPVNFQGTGSHPFHAFAYGETAGIEQANEPAV